MKLVETSVKRPVGVIMIVLAIMALGVVSLRNLAIDLYPEIDLPVAVVSTSYEGAAPEDVEKLVSRPIESAVSSIEGIELVQSQSQFGASIVFMMFNTGADLDTTLIEVREQVDRVKAMLPQGANEPVVLRFDPQQMPVMWVSMTGDSPENLQQLAEDRIVPYLERQGDVGSIQVQGGKIREVQVITDPEELAEYGLTAGLLVQAINANNQSASAGVVQEEGKDLQVRITGEFQNVEDIKNVLITTPMGERVTLEEVADVRDTFQEQTSLTKINGEQAVVLTVLKKSDGNTVEVSDNVRGAVDELNEDLPGRVELKTVLDTADFIRISIDSVMQNMLIGGLFAVLVLFLFLKSLRATIVIGLSIPIAVISTFTLMYFTGETVNVLTLGGLALGIGMMVDSSIVILEHIVTYRSRGYSLKEAAKLGASELAPAVIASTTTTLVVFLPIVFVEGIASELFTPLALTVSFSLIASLAVSVTLIPMLSSKLLGKISKDNGRRYWFDQFLDWINKGYRVALRFVLRRRWIVVIGTVLMITGSILLIPQIGTEFIPESDQGQVQISVETEQGTTLEQMEDLTRNISEKLDAYEESIETSFLTVGGGGYAGFSSQSNTASYTIQLVGPSEREMDTRSFVEEVTEDLEEYTDEAEIVVADLATGISGAVSPIQVNLNGPEYEKLEELAADVMEEIKNIDGITTVESSVTETRPELNLIVDEEAAADYGLTYADVMRQVQMAMNGQIATRFREGGNEINVRFIIPENQRETVEDLKELLITSQRGLVELQEVASIEEVEGPSALTRQNQQNQVNVNVDIADRDLGSVSSDIEKRLEAMDIDEDYSFSVGGQAEDMQEAFSDLAVALVFSIFLVYAVMAVQFENFLFPLIIMFSMPATVIGVVGGLYVTGLPLSVPAFIGVIMLAGIVVNNAIVLVDYINILRRGGMERQEAILEAGPSRLRPILMTSLTTILGMIPLALAFGVGAEAQQPLAIVIIFGLGISMLFTLLLIPVVYTLFDDLTRKFVKNREIK
ncbi:efflux RND transporter permease subunit [Bacillaceae bacterium S4-13-56]